MRLRGLAPIILAALLLTPAAVAGTSRRPDIEDTSDRRAPPHLDLVKAWVQGEPSGLRLFVQAAQGARSDTVYWMTFHVEETDAEAGGIVGYGNDGVLRTHLLETSSLADIRGRIGPGFEAFANDALLAPDRDGAILSAIIPWGAVDGLHEGAQLHGLSAGTAYFSRGASGWQPGDAASTDQIVLASIPSPLSRLTAGALPILVPAWVLPAIVAGSTLAGAAGGFAIARRARGASAEPATVAVPVRAPLPPPGQRFQAAPPPQRR